MKIKTIIQSSFFLAVCCAALIYVVRSKQGLLSFINHKKEFQQELLKVQALEQKNDAIKKEISDWKTNPLEQEKMARQDLGMSFTNEVVYITPKNQ